MSKILILAKYYPPYRGGIETVVEDHVHLLQANSHMVTVLSYNSGSETTKEILPCDARIVRYKTNIQFLSQPISVQYMFHAYWAQKYDVIVLHEPNPLIAFIYLFRRLHNTKLVVFWHSDVVRPTVLSKIISRVQKKVLNRSNRIVTTSDRLKKHSQVLSKVSQDKIKIAPLWCKDPLKDPANVDTSNNTKEKKFDFIFIGRPTYYKGFDTIIRAIEHFPEDMFFSVAVVGCEETEIGYDLTKKIKEKFTFMGNVDNIEKGKLLKKSKFLLFPSTEVSEAFGVSQIEALSYGIPVINTNLDTGVPWVSLHGVSGITIEPGNDKSLKKAMIKCLLMDDQEYEVMSVNARNRYVELFSPNVCEKKLLSALFE